jgi:hypothetical protein
MRLPWKCCYSTRRWAWKDNFVSVGQVESRVEIGEMCPSVGTSSEIELCVFVGNGFLCIALVKGPVTVQQNSFGPISEYVFWGISRQYSLPNLSLRPISRTTIDSETALITIFYRFWNRVSSTSSSSLHKNENILAISLMKIHCRWWAV